MNGPRNEFCCEEQKEKRARQSHGRTLHMYCRSNCSFTWLFRQTLSLATDQAIRLTLRTYTTCRSVEFLLQTTPSTSTWFLCFCVGIKRSSTAVLRKNSIWLSSDRDVGTCFFGLPSLENLRS